MTSADRPQDSTDGRGISSVGDEAQDGTDGRGISLDNEAQADTKDVGVDGATGH